MTTPPADHRGPRPTVAVLGAGIVGRTLARGWAGAGYPVVFGSRDPHSDRIVDAVAEANVEAVTSVRAALPDDAARSADIVVITVPGDHVPELISELGDATLHDRVTIDATNNLAAGAVALNSVAALRSAGAQVYRAYNTVGWENMARPSFDGRPSDMLYTGPDADRARIERLIADTGFRPVHLGDGDAPLALVDAVARLWFHLAFDRRLGRRIGFKILTEADDRPDT